MSSAMLKQYQDQLLPISRPTFGRGSSAWLVTIAKEPPLL